LTNTVNDLLPVGSFLVPSEWPSRASSKTLEDLYPNDPVEQIAEHLSSIMVRRKMTEVGANLPKRHDHRILVDLTLQQRKALEDLENAAAASAREGFFEDKSNRMHAFAKLQTMRQIINTPSLHNVKGGNPKIEYAIDLAQSFINSGRKGVIFCADRTSFKEISERLVEENIKYVKIWGSTPPLERISAEKTFHSDPETKLVLCTIQAGSESWSASPTATWLISTAYMYAPSVLAQMEARVYRMNSDPNGPDIDICYLHASAPNGTLDDRMVEILENKKYLFAKVVDRDIHTDTTKLHYSMNDLMYLLTGNSPEQQPLIGSIDNKNVTRYTGKSNTKPILTKSRTKIPNKNSKNDQDGLFSDLELDNLSY
jgi:SNF2 family DNA or RNA helicase